jgi:hypothetical protein
MQSQPLRAKKLGLITSYGSQVLRSSNYDVDAYVVTLYGCEAWDFVLRVGSSQKLDPTLNPNPTTIFAYNNQDLALMIYNGS